MDKNIELKVDLTPFSDNITRATEEFEKSIRENVFPVAEILEQKFRNVGETIGSQLAKAAKDGSISIKKLSKTIAFEFAKVAIGQVIKKPLETVFKSAFGGARLNGGFAAHNKSYLVGERGPEIFVPGGSGHIVPSRGPSMGGATVNLNISGVSDIEGFKKSQAQIAGSLSRILSQVNRIS